MNTRSLEKSKMQDSDNNKPTHQLKVQIYFIWIFLLIIFALFAYHVLPKHHKGNHAAKPIVGKLESPAVAWGEVEHYLSVQYPDHYLDDLKKSINTSLQNTKGHFSIFLKDLETGAWLGINENDTYKPWSLLKISVVATLLKKVERRQLSLHQTVALTPEEVQAEIFLCPECNISTNGMPMKELINRIIELSDNTASGILGRCLKGEEFQECLQATGLPTVLPNEPKNHLPDVSPKQFTSLLKSLYYSSYLQPQFSELILSLMSDTAALYGTQIEAGLPPGIKFVHKVGFNAGCGDFHDCGIIYLPSPHKPYVLCVMSTGSTREEADHVISTISRQVYSFLVNHK
jgi:beta-lactamase class A